MRILELSSTRSKDGLETMCSYLRRADTAVPRLGLRVQISAAEVGRRRASRRLLSLGKTRHGGERRASRARPASLKARGTEQGQERPRKSERDRARRRGARACCQGWRKAPRREAGKREGSTETLGELAEPGARGWDEISSALALDGRGARERSPAAKSNKS